MELRGLRSHFQDCKFNTANWMYSWSFRSNETYENFPCRPNGSNNLVTNQQTQAGDNPPYYFPSVYAFLCSKNKFKWEIEIYDVKGQNQGLTLNFVKRLFVNVQGLGIPSPTSQNLRFSERSFIPLNDKHQNIVDSLIQQTDFTTPKGLKITGYKYWTEELLQTMEKTIDIQANTLGLTDMPENFKQWEFRAHGRLIDMAVFID